MNSLTNKKRLHFTSVFEEDPCYFIFSSAFDTDGGGYYPNMTVLLLGFEVQVTEKAISSYR